MGTLSVGLVFIGYVLVYAAVAEHGRFAQSPWSGVFTDAYDGDVISPSDPGLGAGTSGDGSTTAAPARAPRARGTYTT